MGDFKDERTRLLRGEEDTVDSGTTKEQGKWEYVWGEVVCYAKVSLTRNYLRLTKLMYTTDSVSLSMFLLAHVASDFPLRRSRPRPRLVLLQTSDQEDPGRQDPSYG